MEPQIRTLIIRRIRALQLWARNCCCSVAQSCPTLYDPMDARQASLSFTISWSLFKLMSIESVMPFNYLVLCGPLHLLPSIFPSIRLFSNETALHVKSIIQAIDSNTLWEFYNFESIYACSLEEKL